LVLDELALHLRGLDSRADSCEPSGTLSLNAREMPG
jgi:hypothetical protein